MRSMNSEVKADYENNSLAILLQDIKRGGGGKEVTDEYLLIALGWPLIRRYDLLDWVARFATRHNLIYERDKKLGRFKFIRASF